MTRSFARAFALISCFFYGFGASAAMEAGVAAAQTTPLTMSGPFGSRALTSFDGVEAMSTLFRYQLELAAEASQPLSFEAVLGQEITVTLTLANGSSRSVSGICSSISETVRDGRPLYHLELVPKLSLLTLQARSRIFQALSVPEILTSVLSDAGIRIESDLTRDYPRRDFCVQYRETDFNFISRLMEEEGIFYFFTQGPSGHSMVLGDSNAALPTLPGGGAAQFLPAVQRRFGNGVTDWTKTQELRPGKFTLWDHNFQFPSEHFEASETLQETVAVGEVTHRLRLPTTANLEIYDYPGGYASRFDGVSSGGIQTEGQATVRIRMQEQAAMALAIAGGGNLAQFVSGHRFTLVHHPNANGDYVLTSVHHVAKAPKGKLQYTNNFTCIPDSLAFRPPRVTPRPIIAGAQSAVVTGPAGQQVFTDSFGRVKVQFHWDRQGTSNENSSAWVRVGAMHAGLENGFVIVPRVGDEVIVSFLEGDPDRPVILGSVFGPNHLPPR